MKTVLSLTAILLLTESIALFAQTPTAPQATDTTSDPAPPIEEVVVTGSRIASANSSSASPIQVLSAEAIQTTGRNDISDVLAQLPQILGNDLGQDLGNRTSGLTTAGGVATADLRGLGPNRTLVLVDGRRLGVGSPNTAIQQPAPDLDQIPLFMVDRVEVLTGGASAVYGSDAIAGVVDFILKKDFQGLQIDSQVGVNWHSNHNGYAEQANRDFGSDPLTGTHLDGRNRNFSAIFGSSFADGQGNITGWLNYYHQDPVSSGQRDFGQCQLGANSSNGTTIDGATCVGSSNSNFFNPLSGPNSANAYSVSGTSFVPLGSVATTPPASYNSQQFIYMQREDSRYNAGFNAHYDLTKWIKPYAQFSFMDDRTSTLTAPTALFRGSNPNNQTTGNYTVNCGNPFLSDQEISILGCTPAQVSATNQLDPANQVGIEIGRRNIEGGDRVATFSHTNYRAVLGSTGEITKGFSYDAYAQYYYVTYFGSSQRYFNFNNVDNSLLATRNAAGAPVCLAGGFSCVPYNIFADGGVTQDALNYLQTVGTQQGTSTLRTYHADFTGELGEYGIRLPSAHDGVALNIGWEHRNENVTLSPDAVEQSGQLSGFGSAVTPINAGTAVDEGFAEVRIPLAQDLPGAKDLLFSPGFRHSSYSTSGGINTYKFDLQWAPTEDLRLRASYQRAIRAPSTVELFNQPLVGLIQLGNDPCAPSSPGLHDAPRSLADCLHTVAPTQQAAFTAAYNAGSIPNSILGQLSQQTGGNTSLQPEKSKSYTAGLVFTPAAVPGLSGSIDWYNIKIDQIINVIPANVILSNCLDSGDPAYCSQLVRQPNTFSLTGNAVATGGYIVQQNFNIGSQVVEGIDLQTAYKMSLPKGLGALRLGLTGSFLIKDARTPLPGAHAYNCVGLFGTTCQVADSRWRHIVNATWVTPLSLSIGANWRFIGKVGYDGNDSDPTLHATGQATFGAYNEFDRELPNVSYLDVYGSWDVYKGIQLRGGINNVLDKDPPLTTYEISAGGNANTYGIYDQLGRQVYLAVTAKF